MEVMRVDNAHSGVPAACCISNRCQCGCRQQSRFFPCFSTSTSTTGTGTNTTPNVAQLEPVHHHTRPSCQCACTNVLPQTFNGDSKSMTEAPFNIDTPPRWTVSMSAVELSTLNRRDKFQRQVQYSSTIIGAYTPLFRYLHTICILQ